MALTLETAARNYTLADLADALDGGSLVILDAADTALATLGLNANAFAVPAAGVATANAITADDDAAATGTATQFQLRTAATALLISGTAGESGTDLVLDSADIEAGDTVTCSSLTLTMPAG